MKSRSGRRADRGSAPARGRDGAAASYTPPRWIGAFTHPALGSALAALLLYLPAVRYGFVRDDHELIGDNNFLHNSGYLHQLLTTDFWGSVGGDSGLWRPLITLSYWVDGRISNWLPAWFHGVNLVSHGLATAVLALLLSEIGLASGAVWIASLWYALMPTHVESVAWVSGRTDVWCGLFGMLALLLNERGARGTLRTAWAWRLGGLAAFALALLSKEAAAPLLAVAAALSLARNVRAPGGLRSVAIEVAPWLVVLVVWMAYHLQVSPSALAATHGWRNPSAAERLWTSIALFPSYLAFLMPGFPFGPDWAIAPARGPLDWRVPVGLVLHALALVTMVRAWRRSDRLGVAVLLLWLPLAMLELLALWRGVMIQGGRHLYLPSAGAAWVLGIGVHALWKRGLKPTTLPRWLVPAAMVALLVSCVDQSLIALGGWRSDETMYRMMIHAQPKNPDGYLGLALVKIGQRKDRTALQALDQAAALDSTRYEIATHHAAIAARYREWPEVIRWARLARARGATEADSWLLEVAALQSLQRLDEAGMVLDTLMAIQKSDPDVAAAYGRQKLLQNRPQQAVKPLEYAAGWNPNDPSIALLLGDAYARVKSYDRARAEIKRAIGLDPSNVDAWLRLAVVCHLMMDINGRDEALNNAANLPGSDPAKIQQMWKQMAGVGDN